MRGERGEERGVGAAVNWHLGPDWHVSRAHNMIIMIRVSEYSQSREEKALSYSEVLNSNSSASESGFWKDKQWCVMMLTRHIVCIPRPDHCIRGPCCDGDWPLVISRRTLSFISQCIETWEMTSQPRHMPRHGMIRAKYHLNKRHG